MVKRESYSRVTEVMPLPNLLEIQTKSYEKFLQQDIPPRLRKKGGLHGAFLSLFPVSDVKGYYSLEYDGYKLGVPKYSLKECKERGVSYAAPLKVDMSLLVYEQDGEVKKFIEKISNEVYIGEIPLMTNRGTFVINGAERVIVSQLHRSPGITFDEVTHSTTGKTMLGARLIPQRGSWVELLLDTDNVLWVNIDRRKKMPASVLLRALGYSRNEDIVALFYSSKSVKVSGANKGKIVGSVVAETVFNKETGEIIFDVNENITDGNWSNLSENKISHVKVLLDVPNIENMVIRNTLIKDETKSEEEALFYIYATMRPGPPPNVDTARNLVARLFFDEKRYDLGDVGRYRINSRLKVSTSEEIKTLTKDDFIEAFKYMLKLSVGDGFIDDIDHLGNRRVRSVGELLSAQFAVGLTRMVRTIRERLSIRDTENHVPQDLINARTVSTVIQAFFGSSQLSQFLDQTNPLSELTHKRRVSALGPGGLTRERAGFEVRDVHHTHYGRLCPIETPEGPNIGLIASISTYARVNNFGFIETPYQKVDMGKLTGEIDYLTADEEDNYYIIQASVPIGKNGVINRDPVFARYRGDFPIVSKNEVSYMDISPMQLVSIAAGLIPFLEHDDANRALMGSNMQRQAVPLLQTEAPYIGTGLEKRAAVDSGCLVIAKNDGILEKLDASSIVIRKTKSKDADDILGLMSTDSYDLVKFQRSNQDTCINQKVCVSAGQRVKAGDILADGHATKNGELALGRNVLVAYMPWRGFNYEDAIIVSEKLVADDIYTSLHIVVFETEVRDTKRGPEELTREIPNVSEEAVKDLDYSYRHRG
jgi:DNA-directed RNA polymerase subunit beta